MAYGTPTDFWQLAAPPDSLFEDHGFEPGPVGAVTKAGTGLGGAVVSPRSNPRDAWPVVVRCVEAGELNSNYVNPGQVPRFQASYNGGTSYWWEILTPEQTGAGRAVLKVVKGGFSLDLVNGTAGAPVTVGAGDAALTFTPLRAGAAVTILVGSRLTHDQTDGELVLTVTASTTATEAAAYLQQRSAIYSYFRTEAGGTGAGVVQAAPRRALPFSSFDVGDTWSFQTAPSPDVVAAQKAAFDHMNGRLRSTFRLPLLSYDSSFVMCEQVYTRWFLLKRRGLDKRQDMRGYNPSLFEEGKPWLDGVANGQIRPDVVQAEPGATLFPDITEQLDPLGPECGSLPI